LAELPDQTGFFLMRVAEWMHDIVLDARYAFRALLREPLFSGFVILALALGIGGNAAMFGVVDRLLIRGPEHITEPRRMMRVYWAAQRPLDGESSGSYFGYVTYGVLKSNAHSFDGVAAYSVNPNNLALGRGVDAQLISAGHATADMFPTLGVHPALGRFFTADEDRTSGAEHVVVLGYGLWQSKFDGAQTVLGATVVLGDEPYTVVGVAPKRFTGPELGKVDVWMPMSLRSAGVTQDWTTTFNAQWLQVIARLKPGVSIEQANADATGAYQHAYPGRDPLGAKLFVAPLSFNGGGHETAENRIARWLLGVAVVVLLIACSNVVNLLLARGARRRRELAVRLALGAGRARLVRLLLTESVMLALAGGVAGLVVAWIAAQLMRSILLPSVEWTSSPVDARVVGLSSAIALSVGIVVGLVPAVRASRLDLTSSLKSGVREGGGQGMRLRATLTVAQAALSIVLLVGAGLFVRSLWRIRSLDLGIQPDRVLVVSLRWQSISKLSEDAKAHERARRQERFLRELERVRLLPEVEHAGLTVGLPFNSAFSQSLRVPGWDTIPMLNGGGPYVSAVTRDYFATVGTRVLAGRAFTDADRAGSEPVAIVNELMARMLWPRRNPIGECLFTGSVDSTGKCARIVGVVAVARRDALKEEPAMQYYIPFGQEKGIGGTNLVIRPRGDVASVIGKLRGTFQEIDPSVSYVKVETLQNSLEPQLRPWRLGVGAFGMMGVLALLIAAVGLYSVLSYLVAQRTHEFGVRIALGAGAADILALILRSSLGMVVMGVAIGLGIALALGQFVEPLLFDTSARDPLVLGAVAAILLIVALVASVVPALRAKDVNPLEALRSD
jgi:predicted permease